jgi:hypothetical protein
MFGKLFSRTLRKTSIVTPKTWRQGDVFIITSDDLPDGLKPRPPVLAEGEVTGHAHRLQAGSLAQVLGDGAGGLFLSVEGEDATIIHEEHGPVTVPRGSYVVRIQREYHPKEIRRVID